ncbi:MAG: response regulator [Bacillota bacterium]|nr:response regulator [Bacillota bacterium]
MGRRVLIVDDSSTVRSYHRKVLESAGFTAAEAVNGYEALEKALQAEFDIYLVDINMTKGTGLDFLREVRANPELAAVPAVVISSERTDDDLKMSLCAGANVHFVKPVAPQALAEACLILTGEVVPGE